jgi:hypothetical protein
LILPIWFNFLEEKATGAYSTSKSKSKHQKKADRKKKPQRASSKQQDYHNLPSKGERTTGSKEIEGDLCARLDQSIMI